MHSRSLSRRTRCRHACGLQCAPLTLILNKSLWIKAAAHSRQIVCLIHPFRMKCVLVAWNTHTYPFSTSHRSHFVLDPWSLLFALCCMLHVPIAAQCIQQALCTFEMVREKRKPSDTLCAWSIYGWIRMKLQGRHFHSSDVRAIY